MEVWYEQLVKPPLTPPNWVFSPVWTLLYIMIVVSIVMYLRSLSKPGLKFTGILLLMHLCLNFIWPYLFFHLRSPGLALIDILFLDLTLVLLIRRFFSTNHLAAGLLIPYLLWVLFATYLNIGIAVLNGV